MSISKLKNKIFENDKKLNRLKNIIDSNNKKNINKIKIEYNKLDQENRDINDKIKKIRR